MASENRMSKMSGSIQGSEHSSIKAKTMSRVPDVTSPPNDSETSFKFHVESPPPTSDSKVDGRLDNGRAATSALEATTSKKSDKEPIRQAVADQDGVELEAVPLHKRLLDRTKSLRLKHRSSVGSRISVASFRSQKSKRLGISDTSLPDISLRPRPQSAYFPRDMKAWQAEIAEASDHDSFIAVDPYDKPKRRSASASKAPARKPQIEASAWTTPVEYAPQSPVSTFGEGNFNERPLRGFESHKIPSTASLNTSGSDDRPSTVNHDSEARAEKGHPSSTLPFNAVVLSQTTYTPNPGNNTSSNPPRYTSDTPEKSVATSFMESETLPLPNTTSHTNSGGDPSYFRWWIYISKQAYLYILLGLPSLYFTRVVGIFDEANIGIAVMKRIVLDQASTKKMGSQSLDVRRQARACNKLQRSWQHFIDTLIREWKTLNIISVLLLSAILGLLQIGDANADPLVHYAALYALVSALVSLLLGCIYIVRFNNMRKPHKAIAWAQETQKELEDVGILRNVWILLALPAVWLTWSIIFYVLCIVAYIWRSDPLHPPQPFDEKTTLAARCIVTSALALAVIYGGIVVKTFVDFGTPMDMRFKQEVEAWQQQKQKNLDSKIATFDAFKPFPESLHSYPSHQGYISSDESDDDDRGYHSFYLTKARKTVPDGHSKGVRFHSVPSISSPFRQANDLLRPQHPSPISPPTPFAPNDDPRFLSRYMYPSDSDTSPTPELRVKDFAYPTLVGQNQPIVEGVWDSDLASVALSHTVPATHHESARSLHCYQPRPVSRHRRYHTFDGASVKDQAEPYEWKPVEQTPSHNALVLDPSGPECSPFFNSSPHQILYHGQVYPTATHLLEGIKYVKHHPELAEHIRSCPDVEAVYDVSRQYIHLCRNDWDTVSTLKMETVLHLKFTQHPELRAMLLGTYPRPLVLADGAESLPMNGLNVFNAALSRVRDRLFQETGASQFCL